MGPAPPSRLPHVCPTLTKRRGQRPAEAVDLYVQDLIESVKLSLSIRAPSKMPGAAVAR